MRKEHYIIEYQLNRASIPVLWQYIGTPLGMSVWFASGVTVNGNEYTFSWDQYEQTALLLEEKQNSHIRFQWEEDVDTVYYFELKLSNELVTGDLSLIITDYCYPNERIESILLWNNQIEELRRKIGI